MSLTYLRPVQGGDWALSRTINGRSIDLVENRNTDRLDDPALVLRALNIDPSVENLDLYFPMRNGTGCRCPNLELLELFAKLDLKIRDECGV